MPWKGFQNTMGRGFDIPYLGWSKYQVYGLYMPWKKDSIYHG
jgi:hypothetical protein